jgi:hypothetical protein
VKKTQKIVVAKKALNATLATSQNWKKKGKWCKSAKDTLAQVSGLFPRTSGPLKLGLDVLD